MDDRVENAKREAQHARELAMASGNLQAREQWLMVATFWEELAREYVELRKSGVFVPGDSDDTDTTS